MGCLEGWRRFGVLLAIVSQLNVWGAIMFESDLVTLNEADGEVALKVRRDSAEGELTVNYRILFDGTEASADFLVSSGTIDFAAGQTERTISLSPRRDGKVEGTEIFDVVLSEAQSATVLAKTTIRLMDEQVAAGRDYAFT